LPSVDSLLQSGTGLALREQLGMDRLADLARTAVGRLREELLAGNPTGDSKSDYTREELLARAELLISDLADREKRAGLHRVINATGVILHTNLGRAPLSVAARDAISNHAAGYCTLEYDLETGNRGRRGGRVEELLKQLTGAEDALVVNNCAAAALLTLTVLAQGGEAIVSRGELVEIGGDFRIPDVMVSSGARLIEVGTTNRTRVSDYVRAISGETRAIMRVHPSNYRIVGFTQTPALAELAEVAHLSGIPLYEDAGSGVLVSLSAFDVADEPVIAESIAGGADIVTFSGDKLLGGPQAGLIVGKAEYVGRMRKHPLFRALRADKLILAVLEATLDHYCRGTQLDEIPVLRALAMSRDKIDQRAHALAAEIESRNESFRCEIIAGQSAIGGGSAPTTHPPTALVALTHASQTAEEIEQALRNSTPPVIARISEGRVLLDLRTVQPSEERELVNALSPVP
jgi:L-seryl-tRNA(Ser) seleniumtransferase